MSKPFAAFAVALSLVPAAAFGEAAFGGLIVLSPQARLAAAQQAPGTAALRAYEELAADSTAPDSIRTIAAGRRADAAFALRDYRTARDYYSRAAQFEKGSGRYRYRMALASLADRDTAAAVSMLSWCADSGDTVCAPEAQTVLGELALRRGRCAEAYGLFQKTGPFSAKNSWSLPACRGKIEAARCLGLTDSAAAYERLLAGQNSNPAEDGRRGTGAVTTAHRAEDSSANVKKPVSDDSRTKSVPARAAAVRDTSFSLQVAAFGSKGRAIALKKRLAPKFPDVSCVAAVIDGKTFFRVLVGTFRSHDAAERFARQRFVPQGLGYRVVIK